MFWDALRRELALHGPKCLKEIFPTSSSLENVCQYCHAVDTLAGAQSRSSMLELLRQIANACEEGTHFHKVLSASLEAKEMQEQADLQLHQLLGAERYRCEAFWITVSNLDDGIAFTCKCYSDTTLGWL